MEKETAQEFQAFLETLVIEELIKEFDFNGDLSYEGKKYYYDGQTYFFKDEFGFIWERDVPYREWMDIAMKSPKIRARK